MTRKEAREQAFIITFEKTFQDSCIADIISDARESLDWESNEYVDNVSEGIESNKDDIDSIIASHLKSGWSISRLSKVTLSLLRLAVYEMKYTDVPAGVAINETVELCKTYATDADASFLNGVLGAVARENAE